MRLSLNQKTTNNWSVREAAGGCARAGIDSIGLWQDKISEAVLSESARVVRYAGLRVSGLCGGSMFPVVAATEPRLPRRQPGAVEKAATLGTDVLVCGPAPERDLEAARVLVEEGISELAPHVAPQLSETEDMILGSHSASMRRNATLINTSRVAVVQEAEMVEVLEERPDLWAVLDVTHPEPPEPDSRLYDLPDVVLTHHIADPQGSECWRMGRLVVDELRRYVEGEPLEHEIIRERVALMA